MNGIDNSNVVQIECPLNCIETNLWLGSLSAAKNLKVLQDRQISFILTVDSSPLPKEIYDQKNLLIKYIQVNDTPREDLLSHFEEAYEFIESGLRKGGVLVHCYYGISRSTTIIISYLMKKNQWALQSAYEYVKSKRSCIGPNPGFMAQLQLYENMGYTINVNNMQYKMFRLYIAAYYVRKFKTLPQSYRDVIKIDPSLLTVQLNKIAFKCKKCRRILAQISNVIPHMPKKKYSWRYKLWSGDLEKINICFEAYFIEPLMWMRDVSSSIDGKLHCPNVNCKQKLGSFSWVMGCQCPCGTQVSPAFYLIPSKVDKEYSIQSFQNEAKA